MKEFQVLIIEDEIVIYMHIKRVLFNLGLKKVHVAKNYNEAMNISSKNSIDLILSDINLNDDVNGIEVSKKIQNLYNAPIIFITAYKDKDLLEQVSKLKILGYLLKPYRAEELELLLELAILKYKQKNNKSDLIQIGEYFSIKTHLLYILLIKKFL